MRHAMRSAHALWLREAAVAVSLSLAILPLRSVHAESAQREQELEKRVEYLEKRLAEVEALLKLKSGQNGSAIKSRTTLRTAAALAKAKPVSVTGITDTTRADGIDHPDDNGPQALAATEQQSKPPEQAATGQTTAAGSPANLSGNDAPSQPGTPSGSEEGAPQEPSVLRQNSVTLNPKGIEASTDLEYATRHTDLQQDRGLLSNTAIRYGVLRWLELSLTIPAGYTTRTTNIALGQNVTKTVSGLGDLLLQANARIVEQTQDWPGVVFSLGTFLPTGRSPYDFSDYSLGAPGAAATPNPNNILADYFSQGAWGLRTNLQFYKTVDPLILFFGFGVDCFFPQQFNGYAVSSGVRYNYNAGFSFAASERTTLGFTLNGEFQSSIKVDGRSVFDSSSEPTVARLTIIQRIAKNTYLEPSISVGLNSYAPDFALGLGLRVRF